MGTAASGLSEAVSQSYIHNLLTSGKRNAYLAHIDRPAQERFERFIEDMEQAQGMTGQRKDENTLEWVGQLGNIRVCAREIVNKEIIFA